MSTRSDIQRSANDKIRLAAASQGIDANRLRRSLIFHRLLARLAPHGFVLKGGFCLEVRLPRTARATKDVDLVGKVAMTTDPVSLIDTLEHLLEDAVIDDGFSFRIGGPVRLRDEGADAHAWRISVTARLGGAEFERVKLDVVGQLDEVNGATEMLTVPSQVSLPGVADVVVEAVDVYQHAAEKYHAYARIYARDRPSSRVKDLVDLVLLIESELLVSSSRLGERLHVVYAEREGIPPAKELPTPPGDWERPYAALAMDLNLAAVTTTAAYELVAEKYAAVVVRTSSGGDAD